MLRSNRERNTTKPSPRKIPQNNPTAEFTGKFGFAGKNGGLAGSTTRMLLARMAEASPACFCRIALASYRIMFIESNVLLDCSSIRKRVSSKLFELARVLKSL